MSKIVLLFQIILQPRANLNTDICQRSHRSNTDNAEVKHETFQGDDEGVRQDAHVARRRVQ